MKDWKLCCPWRPALEGEFKVLLGRNLFKIYVKLMDEFYICGKINGEKYKGIRCINGR
ncbi:MAG TPA: hypothetical protein H9740_06405 [Candidatus Hungatella pullicola]|nr:hypothetical protein [Candidatus Hungatella pullicola]